jgi:hypothetical protein
VGSRHHAAIALPDTLESFPGPCLCSLAPSHPPISTRTPHRRPPSAAASCSSLAAHPEPPSAIPTPQLAPYQPHQALRPLHRAPSALHRLPDARRRLPPPPPPLSSPVAPNPKRMLRIDDTNTFPTAHWCLRAGSSPVLATGASPSTLPPPPPLRTPVEVTLSGHPDPRHVVQSDRCELLRLSLPSDLAVGDPPPSPEHGRPIPASLLPLAEDRGLEGAKVQGAVCKPHDSEE